MGKALYDWRAADKAIREALVELFAAQRHQHHGKRANALKDLTAAEHAIARAAEALEPKR